MQFSTLALTTAAAGIGGRLAVQAGASALNFAEVLADKLTASSSASVDSPTAPLDQQAGLASQANQSSALDSLKDFLRSIGLDFEQAVQLDFGSDQPVAVNASSVQPWQRTAIESWLEKNPEQVDAIRNAG